jgi:hypothetical protein
VDPKPTGDTVVAARDEGHAASLIAYCQRPVEALRDAIRLALPIVAGDRRETRCAWTYRDPAPRYAALRDHVAVYPGRMDACWLDDERVRSQEGDFYGGWITADVTGPFKGGPGTFGW